MSNEQVFRLLTFLILASAVAISGYFRAKADRQGGQLNDRPGGRLVLALRLYGLGALLPLFAYLINPDWVTWARFPVSDGLRWLAALVAASLVPIVYWIFVSIGDNISPTAATRQGATLVTRGPYRWVRHPLYTTGASLILALTVLSAMWWLIVAALPALAVIVWRTPAEEARLIQAFGDDYRDYMRRTGRFLPRLTSPLQR